MITLDSIAEVMTAGQPIYIKFDDEDEEQVIQVEQILGELADEGEVWALEFHRSQ